MSLIFTVFFDDPFWVGLFTLYCEDGSKYARIIFGKNPPDAEIYRFLLKRFSSLEFPVSIHLECCETLAENPKRWQREAAKDVYNTVGTKKSYQAAKDALQQSGK